MEDISAAYRDKLDNWSAVKQQWSAPAPIEANGPTPVACNEGKIRHLVM